MSTVSAVQPDLRRKRVNWQKVLVIVLFAVVPLFLLILFTYIPFAKMIQFSFHNMSYTKDKGFVGLDNYLKIFTKSEYVDAMLLSLYYMAGAVVQLALALFLASVLSLERIRGAGIWKAILFFPFLVNGIAIGYIFKYFYTRGFVLDSVLQAIGIPVLAAGPEHQQLVAGFHFRLEVLRPEYGAVYRGNRVHRSDAV